MQEDWVRLVRNDNGPKAPGKIVYSEGDITNAVGRIAHELEERCSGQEPTFVILLKGGARFGCDLISAFKPSCKYDFIGVSSYGDNLSSSGKLEFYNYRLDRKLIDNRTVVLVDDICDSGATFAGVAAKLNNDFSPGKLFTCAMIWRDGSEFTPDLFGYHYKGDEFLVGYGLGAGELYRNLNEIVILEEDK